ncbi:MAG: efflux RND transporter periplasmic adaptor subunit [Lautropia sp.]|nr:efflux RND transporter periplasmic adaptor subunit [Lautropia sp.]
MSSAVESGAVRRPVLWVTLLLLLLIGGGLWFWVLKPASQQGATSSGPPPGPRRMGGGDAAIVSTTPVVQGAFPVMIRAVGTVTPFNAVTVVPQVEGRLLSVAFEEGQRVKAGQLLARIDPRAFEVSLAEARGQQAQNRAELSNARRDLARYEQLFRQDSIARQQLDNQRALVRQLEGRAETDQARIDNARLQLEHTKVLAPVEGRLGLLKAAVGSLIGPGTAEGLVSIIQIDPISVLFSVPEVQLQALREAVRDAVAPGLVVEAWDRSESRQLATGHVSTLDNQIDPATGSLKVRARFDNGDDALFPNQFVNVRLHLKTLPAALSVPVDAVQFGSQGDYVYLIREGKAFVRTVRLGVTSGDRVEILEGLQAGDQVALEGLDRLRDGRAVKVVDPLRGDPDALPATPAASEASERQGAVPGAPAGAATESGRTASDGRSARTAP